MHRWIDLALRIAAYSDHYHRLGAVVVKGGRVLATAPNLSTWGRHAEIRALSRSHNARGATMYIAREGRKMARPCRLCWAKLQAAGVTQVVYTNWIGDVVMEHT